VWWQVNGDCQRGKSTVEAVFAAIVCYIHRSEAVLDRCYTLLGTGMVPWAASLVHKMGATLTQAGTPPVLRRASTPPLTTPASAARSEADDDTLFGNLFDEADPEHDEEAAELARERSVADNQAYGEGWEDALEAARAARLKVCSISERESERIDQVVADGGLIVFARTKAQMNKTIDAVLRAHAVSFLARLVPPAHFVILDEADRMRGAGAEPGDRGVVLIYERQLAVLLGSAPLAELQGVKTSGHYLTTSLPKAVLVADVSATNQLCFLAYLMRAGSVPHRELLDILAFKDGGDTYKGLADCVPFACPSGASTLVPLRPVDKHLNDDVLAWYDTVLNTRHACGLVIASRAVTAANNMVRPLACDLLRGACCTLTHHFIPRTTTSWLPWRR
jgi:hypothetical protein